MVGSADRNCPLLRDKSSALSKIGVSRPRLRCRDTSGSVSQNGLVQTPKQSAWLEEHEPSHAKPSYDSTIVYFFAAARNLVTVSQPGEREVIRLGRNGALQQHFG